MIKPTVLYISPSLTIKGGISSLITGYLKSGKLSSKYTLLTVYSHINGSKTDKFITAVIGLIRTAAKFNNNDIDIVHIHGGGCVSALRKYVYFRLVRLFNCKVIYHIHSGTFYEQYVRLSPLSRRVVRGLLEESDCVICLSELFRVKISDIAPRARTVVVTNSVPLPSLVREHASAAEVRVVYLGFITASKGIFDLLHAMKRIVDTTEKVRLVIGGRGDDEARVRQEVRSLSMEDYVDFLGWLDNEERDNLLATADILVLPSYGEGMPMSILEALSFGIPVVTTRVGGIPDIVKDGENGFLVEPGNLVQLQEKLLTLVRDHNLRNIMGKRGRILVEERHSIDTGIEQIDAIYDSLIRGDFITANVDSHVEVDRH